MPRLGLAGPWLGAAGAASGPGGALAAGAAAGASAAGNGASNGSSEQQPGWLGRLRGSANPRGYSPPPLAGRQGSVPGGGLQRPSWRQEDFDAEMLEASLREQHRPVSAEQARQARDALPAATQGAVGQLIADHGPRVRQHLAYQAMGEWTPSERGAIRTLAAASPEVRVQAFSEGVGSTTGFGESSEPKGGRASTAVGGGGRASPPPSAKPTVEGNGGTAMRAPQDQPPSTDGGGS